MEKNILKNLVLLLGVVTCLGGFAFATKNVFFNPKPQITTNKACNFNGHYTLHDETLQKIQNIIDIGKKGILSGTEIDFVDLKLEKVDLNIEDGHGKLSILLNLKDSNNQLDIHGKTSLVFDISQKDCNTFTLNMTTNNRSQSDNYSDFDIEISGKSINVVLPTKQIFTEDFNIEVSKEFINGKQYLSVASNNDKSQKILFEKIK